MVPEGLAHSDIARLDLILLGLEDECESSTGLHYKG